MDAAVPPLSAEVVQFLANRVPFAETTAVWGNRTAPLRLTSYLAADLPPGALITSVRCVLFHGESVQVMRSRDGLHVLPGGRCEPGETLDETLRREIREEAGRSIARADLIGFIHFHHLGPRPPDYRYPHPDLFQIVYVAEAGEEVPGRHTEDEYELSEGFVPLTALDRAALDEHERGFLDAAVRSRRR